MSASDPIAALRRFNRLYTRRLGLLNERLDGSPFSLTQARVLYELAQGPASTAARIARELGLDPAQLSRVLKDLIAQGLVTSAISPDHAKHRLLSLTPVGAEAFAALEAGTVRAVGGLLDGLSAGQRRRLLAGAKAIETVLTRADGPPFVLRDPAPGELGAVIERQALVYAAEYGWDWTYEGLVAEILGGFVKGFDPAREQAWIAERDGDMAGSIFLMKSDRPEVGKLRLLYVEPSARGLGVGAALVAACVARARQAGYTRLELWTNDVLVSARRLYEAAEFVLVQSAPHRMFGKDLVGQTWALDLRN